MDMNERNRNGTWERMPPGYGLFRNKTMEEAVVAKAAQLLKIKGKVAVDQLTDELNSVLAVYDWARMRATSPVSPIFGSK